jgi:3-dehydroquinate dehydratase/shikimate dehydrogenase
MLCVSIGRTRHKMILAEIQEAAKRGAQLIELRLDFLSKAPDFHRLLANKPCPMVCTIRRSADGGRYGGKEDERLMILRQAIVGGFDWVDLETDLADRVPRFGPVKRIISYHNLRELPKDLEEIHKRMCKQDADVVKIAVKAETPADNLRVLNLIPNAAKPTVAFCVGDLGVPSRILALRYGAPFTYAAFNKERGIAPGILSMEDMVHIYHEDQINAQTRVFGVLGDPVGHSLSPLIHNAAFRALGINAVYLPIRVPRSDFPAMLKDFEKLPVDGYSVTIPHKEAAANVTVLARDELVERTKSANTLIRVAQDDFRAFNTDAEAATEALKSKLATMPHTPQLAGRSALVLGAGGVARSVTYGLLKEQAQVTVSNRTTERAQRLATDAGCRYIEWAGRHSVQCDTVINCTSVGMHPNIDESPLHHSFHKQGVLVFDTVYNPETTLLIREARDRGAETLTGVEMFVRQAALQFRLFTSKNPPLELMRRLVKKALSPIAIKEEATAAEPA